MFFYLKTYLSIILGVVTHVFKRFSMHALAEPKSSIQPIFRRLTKRTFRVFVKKLFRLVNLTFEVGNDQKRDMINNLSDSDFEQNVGHISILQLYFLL